MGAGATQACGTGRLAQELFGVKTPGTLLLFFASSILSFSLIFQPSPEDTAVLSAHGWGYGPHFWQGEFWGLWVNHLLHTRLWHFVCNAYWFLLFGPVLEEILGTRRYLLHTFVAAWAIGLAGNLGPEEGGIGLSGLIYFQFGYLAALAGSQRAAARVLDRPTRYLMWAGLLLVGPALSAAGLVKVGNVVHFSGCLAGLLGGWLQRTGPGRLRRAVGPCLAMLLLAATVLLCRPFWRGDWHFWYAYHSDDPALQLQHYRQALLIDPGNPDTLYNLGLVLFEGGDLEEAERTWLRCLAKDPTSRTVSQALFSLYAQRGDADGMQRWAARLNRLP